jgi:hypothetical protein
MTTPPGPCHAQVNRLQLEGRGSFRAGRSRAVTAGTFKRTLRRLEQLAMSLDAGATAPVAPSGGQGGWWETWHVAIEVVVLILVVVGVAILSYFEAD